MNVLIAEDQPLLRKSLATIIGSAPDVHVVGEAANGQEAVSLARELHPDVILMDIRMPGLNGIEATAAISADQSLAAVKILVLTMFDMDEYVEAALRVGAHGFLLKDSTPEVLLDGIRRVKAGEQTYSPAVLGRMEASFLGRAGNAIHNSRVTALLTKREIEVLALIAEGYSNAEIMTQLFISMATVKTHIGNLLAKIGARDRSQLVIYAYENGVVCRD